MIYVEVPRELAIKSSTYVDFHPDNPSGYVGRLYLSYIEEWISSNRSNLKGKCEYEHLHWDMNTRSVSPSRVSFEFPEDAVLFRLWVPSDVESLIDIKETFYQI